MRTSLNNTIEFFVLLATFFLIPWCVSVGVIGYPLAFLVFMMLVVFNLFRITNTSEISISLCVPIMLSAFQNIGLGIFAPYLSKTGIQVLTILNFLYAIILFAGLIANRLWRLKRSPVIRRTWSLFLLLILYSVLSLVLLTKWNALSILSSARNVFSIFIFYFIGILCSDRIKSDRFERILLSIGVIVILVGLCEIFIIPSMWRLLNITELWTKKGIHLQPSGLPTNFYSSETINGHRIRRMASTFADPVHLGTFLFVLFCLAWYRNRNIIAGICLFAIVLTVSKGAFLGLLIFYTIYVYYKYSRPYFYLALFISFLLGIGFLLYAAKSSANSVFLHIKGLIAAFRNIITNPLGSGLGSNGVLARQFSSFTANADITETGLGMIIAQLGFIGLCIYITFYTFLTRLCLALQDKREKLFCLTILISIMVNMFFNEVALSPNSSAVYYMLIGMHVGKAEGITSNGEIIRQGRSRNARQSKIVN